MRRVGIQSLNDYEIQLTALIRGEIDEALASFDHGLTLTTPQRFD
jgi:hypothetical protein